MKILITLCSFFILVGCGSGFSDSENNSARSDPEFDNSSMITTPENDTDGNGVQDEVEEKIEKRYTNPIEYKQAIYMAKMMQGIVNAHLLDDRDIEQAVRDFIVSASCHDKVFGEHSVNALEIMNGDAFTSFDQYLIYVKATEDHHKLFDERAGTTEEQCTGLIDA